MTIEAVAFDVYGTLFDPTSVSRAVEDAFPGEGDFIGAVWRQKQLEYTWQRTAMDRFADFETVTRDALVYAIRTVRAEVDAAVLDKVVRGFEALALVPEAREALGRLEGRRLAVLSNGSDAMLSALLRHAGIDSHFPVVVSSDRVRAYKPHPRFYGTLGEALGLSLDRVALVSSNGFDLAGAKHAGLATIRVERTPPTALHGMTAAPNGIGAAVPFVALRSQMDELGAYPDHVCRNLNGVADVLDRLAPRR